MEYQPSDMSVPCDSGIINLRVGAIIVKENKILMVKNNKHDYYCLVLYLNKMRHFVYEDV